MKKTQNRVTFEEIADDFSHFEVAFLSFCKASDIISSAVSLISNTPYKPKVALVAYDQICSNISETKLYKDELITRLHSHYEEKSDDEEYAIEDDLADESEEI